MMIHRYIPEQIKKVVEKKELLRVCLKLYLKNVLAYTLLHCKNSIVFLTQRFYLIFY